MPRKNLHSLLASVAACLLAAGVAAQSYPDRPIKLVVPYPPGGSTDPVARLLAADVATRLSQPVVVDNKPGAAGSIGTEFVAKAAPDGHTLLLHTSVIATDPTFKKTLPYSVKQDLAPITLTVNGPYLLVVNPTLPAKNVAELIAYAKANPGKLNFGSAGQGSSGHLIGELFKMSPGIDMVHVPYKGGGPSITGLMANEVQVLFDTISGSGALVESGKLRALAVTSRKRSPVAPELPTVAESGMPDYVVTGWYGMFVPAATPAPVVATLHAGAVKAIKSKEVSDRLSSEAAEIVGSSPQQFGEFLKAEIAKWAAVIKKAQIRPESL